MGSGALLVGDPGWGALLQVDIFPGSLVLALSPPEREAGCLGLYGLAASSSLLIWVLLSVSGLFGS